MIIFVIIVTALVAIILLMEGGNAIGAEASVQSTAPIAINKFIQRTPLGVLFVFAGKEWLFYFGTKSPLQSSVFYATINKNPFEVNL